MLYLICYREFTLTHVPIRFHEDGFISHFLRCMRRCFRLFVFFYLRPLPFSPTKQFPLFERFPLSSGGSGCSDACREDTHAGALARFNLSGCLHLTDFHKKCTSKMWCWLSSLIQNSLKLSGQLGSTLIQLEIIHTQWIGYWGSSPKRGAAQAPYYTTRCEHWTMLAQQWTAHGVRRGPVSPHSN